jgi:hypothetical protein
MGNLYIFIGGESARSIYFRLKELCVACGLFSVSIGGGLQDPTQAIIETLLQCNDSTI